MATEASQPLKITLVASADLSASQYLFVKQDSNGQAAVCTAATDIAIGVLQNKPKAAGQTAEVVVVGVTKVVAAGAINPGAAIAFDSAGKAVSATLQGWGASYVQGTKKSIGEIKVTAATAASDVASAVVNCLNPVPAT